METFSDVKRKLTKGTELKCVRNDHSDKHLNITRKIDVVKTNAIRFEGGSWLHFPKAKYVEILGDNAFSIGMILSSRDKREVKEYDDMWNTKELIWEKVYKVLVQGKILDVTHYNIKGYAN